MRFGKKPTAKNIICLLNPSEDVEIELKLRLLNGVLKV